MSPVQAHLSFLFFLLAVPYSKLKTLTPLSLPYVFTHDANALTPLQTRGDTFGDVMRRRYVKMDDEETVSTDNKLDMEQV